MRLRIWPFGCAVLVLLINVAPLPAGIPASIDACSLLSQAELSTAVGAPMNSGTHESGTTQSCMWSPSGGPRLPSDSRPFVGLLQLWVMPFAEQVFEADKYSAGQENVTSVSGLGDDAYYVQIGR
jgi:hypothetical protein